MEPVVSLAFKLKTNISTALVGYVTDVTFRMKMPQRSHDTMLVEPGGLHAAIEEMDKQTVTILTGAGFEHVREHLPSGTVHKTISFPADDTTRGGGEQHHDPPKEGRRTTGREALLASLAALAAAVAALYLRITAL